MILVAEYDPRNGDPEIKCQINRPKRWRVEIRVRPADGEVTEVKIRTADKFWLTDIHQLAIDAIRDILPEGAAVAEANVRFYADA